MSDEVKDVITRTEQPLLRLRPFQRSELTMYGEWVQNREVLGPFVQAEHKSLAELEADFDIDEWKTNRMRRWILCGDHEQIMGYAHCWEFDPYENHIEFGRILLPQYRGKGLGTAFLQLLVDHVFEETTAHRAQSITACENIAVQRNWAAVGIITEGRLREFMSLNGKYVDCFLGSILRREWIQNKKS